MLPYSSGLRVREVVNLKAEDIIRDTMRLLVLLRRVESFMEFLITRIGQLTGVIS